MRFKARLPKQDFFYSFQILFVNMLNVFRVSRLNNLLLLIVISSQTMYFSESF